MMDPGCDALDLLACPVDGLELRLSGKRLTCAHGHTYPVVHGVPVLLRDDVEQTIGIARQSLRLAREYVDGSGADAAASDPFFIASLGVTEPERDQVRAAFAALPPTMAVDNAVDPVVSHLVAATNGILYKSLAGRLDTVPIPQLRLPAGDGQRLLDIGCNWGRWSIAAARKGYRPVGIDPSLGSVLAAKRLATRFGLPFEGVVGDARHLPFKQDAVDTAFSYSVLQHFSKPDARQAFRQIARVTRPGGTVKIQMASGTGLRSFQHMLARRFQEPADFDVRYWPPWTLRHEFERAFGNASLDVDCYFGLGLQPSDIPILSAPAGLLVRLSELLRATSIVVRPLAYVADSVYLTSRNTVSRAPA